MSTRIFSWPTQANGRFTPRRANQSSSSSQSSHVQNAAVYEKVTVESKLSVSETPAHHY
jgi:hypothetical protein